VTEIINVKLGPAQSLSNVVYLDQLYGFQAGHDGDYPYCENIEQFWLVYVTD